MTSETRQSWESIGRGVVKLVLALVFIILGTIVTVLAIAAATRIPADQITQVGFGQFLSSLFALLGFALLGGWRWLKLRGKAISYTFKVSWVLLIIGIMAIGFSVFDMIATGQGIPDGAPMRLLGVVLLCLGIGISEEFIYRGLLLGGLLAVIGRSRAGVMIAVLISAVIFGFAHVTQDDFAESITAVQALLKVVQTGMFGIVMTAAILHTRNMWGTVVFHSINDFLYLGVPAILTGFSSSGEYTASGDASMMGIGVYAFMILVFLYPTVRSLKSIWRKQKFCLGPFMFPRKKDIELQAQNNAQKPDAVQVEQIDSAVGIDGSKVSEIASNEPEQLH